MNVGRIIHFVSYFIAIAFTLLFAQPSFAQASENNQLTFEGSLTDASGNPINLAGVELIFYVSSANGCYLYGETTTTAGDSQGNIIYRIGSGSLVAGSPNGFTQSLFFGAAAGTTSFAGNNCSVTASDVRVVQVYYPDLNIRGTIKLSTVPYAFSAKFLNGLTSSDFLQVTNDSNTLFYSGSSGQYLTKTASGGLSWTNIANSSVTSSSIATALGYVPASNTTVTSTTINTSLGYTPANSATVTSLSNTVSTSFTSVSTSLTALSTSVTSLSTSLTSVTSQINAVSSTLTSLKNSTAASFAAITSSQWTTTGSNISYTNGNVGIGTSTPSTKLDVSGAVRLGMDASVCSPSIAGSMRYNAGNLEVCNGSAWNSLGMAGAALTSLNGATNSAQSFANGSNGFTPNFVTSGGVHTLNIPFAAAVSTTAGLISYLDYTTFSNKITSSAASVAQVLGYAPVSSTTLNNYAARANNLSDLTSSATARTNLGLGSLATANSIDLGSTSATGIIATARLADQSGVTSGTQYTKVTVDSKGRVVSGAQLSSADVTTALGFTPGSAASGVTSLNGSSFQAQSFANGTSGTSPSFATAGSVHTLNIPLAGSGSVTAGLISNSDYTNFNNKITSSAASVAQVLGYTPANNGSLVNYALRSSNLADLSSSATARTNLGLGALATKDQVVLTADVSGVLPVSNGGSKWSTVGSGIYTVSNTVIGTNSASSPSVRLYVESNTSAQVARFTNTNPIGLGLRIDTASTSSTQYALNVNNASGTMFMVQNDGNIGIGTMSPATALHIVNDNGPSTKDDIQINTFGGNTAALSLQRAKGTAASPTALLANDAIGNLRWDGYTGSAFTNLVAITGAAETDLSTAVNSYVTISTNSNNSMAERVRVTSNGNVGIGTASATAAKLHVAGAVISKPVVMTGAAVDLAQSNTFIISSVGTSTITLFNIVDGGTYTLIITDTTARTYNFSGCTTQYFAPANSTTIAGTRTMYGIITVKNGSNWDCYINWTPGYQ